MSARELATATARRSELIASHRGAGLFVGPFQPSWKIDTLQALGITHILCIAESREQCVHPT